MHKEVYPEGQAWAGVVQLAEEIKVKLPDDPYLMHIDNGCVILTSRCKIEFAKKLVKQEEAFEGNIVMGIANMPELIKYG